MDRRQKHIALVALALALIIALAGAVVALDSAGEHTVTATYFLAATPSPTTGPTPQTSPIPTFVPADYIPPGWRQAGPNSAQTIAFAPGDPSVAYACGALNGKVQVAASTDGGATWQPAQTIASGAGCQISGDPQDARDVAVLVQSCLAGQCVSGGDMLFRSGDGGETWAQMTLPDESAGFEDLLGWAGGSLFAQVGAGATGSASHALAVSTGRNAFAWADNSPLFTQPGLTLTLLAGAGTTLYAGFSDTNASASCLPPAVTTLIATGDGGKTWAPAAFADDGAPISIVAVEPDGGAIIGLIAPDHFVTSSDGGKTWQQIPVFPPNMQPCAIFVIPDGTIVAQLAATGAEGEANDIVSARRGDTGWTTLSSGSVNLDIAAIAVTAQGHPAELWAATQGSLLPFKLAMLTLNPI